MTTFAKKAKKLISLVVALYVFNALLAYADNSAISQGTLNFTLVQGNVKTHLQVPAAYFDTDWTEGVDQGKILSLKMLWPSMAPTSAHTNGQNEKEYEESQRVWQSGHFFVIKLSQGKRAWIGDTIKNNLEKDWIPLTDAKPIPGFKQYTSKIEDYALKRHWLASRILVPVDEDYSKRIYIDCPLNSNLPPGALYCAEHTSLNHYVHADFTFSLSYLQEWKSIDFAARQLFTQMYKPD